MDKEKLTTLIHFIDTLFPMNDFAVAMVIADIRENTEVEGEGRLAVLGNRTGHGKYELMEYAIEHEYDDGEVSDIHPELKN